MSILPKRYKINYRAADKPHGLVVIQCGRYRTDVTLYENGERLEVGVYAHERYRKGEATRFRFVCNNAPDNAYIFNDCADERESYEIIGVENFELWRLRWWEGKLVHKQINGDLSKSKMRKEMLPNVLFY